VLKAGKFTKKTNRRKMNGRSLLLSPFFLLIVLGSVSVAAEQWYLRPEFNYTFPGNGNPLSDVVVNNNARYLLVVSKAVVYCVARDSQGYFGNPPPKPYVFSTVNIATVKAQWHPLYSNLYYAVVFSPGCTFYLMQIDPITCSASVVQSFTQNTVLSPVTSCEFYVPPDATNLYSFQKTGAGDTLFSYQLNSTGRVLQTPSGLGVLLQVGTFYGGLVKTEFPLRVYFARFGSGGKQLANHNHIKSMNELTNGIHLLTCRQTSWTDSNHG